MASSRGQRTKCHECLQAQKQQQQQQQAPPSFHQTFCSFGEGCLFLEHLLPLLQVNDATRLSLVCQDTHRLVAMARSSSPSSSVRWVTRWPTVVEYTRLDDMVNDHGASQRCSVVQVQRFLCYLRDDRNPFFGHVRANIGLHNELWHEDNGGGVPRRILPHDADYLPPGEAKRVTSTQVDAHIYGSSNGGNTYDQPLMSLTLGDKDIPISHGLFLMTFRDMEPFDFVHTSFTQEEQDCLSFALQCMHQCLTQIEHFQDGVEYPSAKYLLNTLPKQLHDFVPEKEHLVPPNDANAFSDRVTQVEFQYVAPPSLEAWREFIPANDANAEVREISHGEIPWALYDE